MLYRFIVILYVIYTGTVLYICTGIVSLLKILDVNLK